MKKAPLVILTVVVVLIAAVVIIGSLFLGTIVKTGIETFGPKITQVSVQVNAVELSVLTGSAKVKGLVVGNPPGYKAPQAISVGSAAVGVNPFSVLSDKVVVRSVRVEAPEITFEGNPLSGNNLSAIMQNVNEYGKGGKPAATNAPAATKTGSQPGKKLEVDDLLITGAKVNFNGATLPLPDIHLTNLGKGTGGITAADLTRRVLDAITSATIKAVVNSASDVGKGAENVGKNLGKSLGNDLSNATKGLGGLFKKSSN